MKSRVKMLLISLMFVGGVVPQGMAALAPIAEHDSGLDPSLLQAVEKRNVEKVKDLFVRGANPNAKDSCDKTALMCAAELGDEQLVAVLLDHGAKATVDACEKLRGYTALMLAAGQGCVNVVKKLLAEGADINKQDGRGFGLTALMVASLNGCAGVVECLLALGAHVDVENSYGDTALVYAAMHGYTGIVANLLDSKASVDAGNKRGMTALMFAASNGCIEVVKNLLKRGAQCNKQDSEGKTALMYAMGNGHSDVAKILLAARSDIAIKDRNGRTVLMYAAAQRDPDVVDSLLMSRADVTATDSDGNTALSMCVASNGRMSVIEKLLDCGVDERQTAQCYWTAMIQAVRNGNFENMEFFLAKCGGEEALTKSCSEQFQRVAAIRNYYLGLRRGATALTLRSLSRRCGADVSYLGQHGPVEALEMFYLGQRERELTALYEALIQALNNEYIGMVKCLLGIRAVVVGFLNYVDVEYEGKQILQRVNAIYPTSLLVSLAQVGATSIVKILLKAQVDVNARDTYDDKSALMYAAESGDLEMVNDLLAAKADVDVRGANEKTALMYAAVEGHEKVAEALLRAGATPNLEDIHSKTAADKATEYGHIGVARMIREFSAVPAAIGK
jgi:ankyrin repeat protein